MRLALLLILAAPVLAQIEAKYSRVSLEGLQALSGDKVPRSAAIYSVKACNVGSAEEPLTDARLMMMSPVPVDDQRIPVMARARERGVRKLSILRDIAGLGALSLAIFGSGELANAAKIATGAATAGLTLLDQRIGQRGAVPTVDGQLSDSGPRYMLAAGECRSGWFVGLFVREFTQATVRFDAPKMVEPQNRPTIMTMGASFEISGF